MKLQSSHQTHQRLGIRRALAYLYLSTSRHALIRQNSQIARFGQLPVFRSNGLFRYINLFWLYRDFISFCLFLSVHFTLSIFVRSFILKKLYCCIPSYMFFLFSFIYFVLLVLFLHLPLKGFITALSFYISSYA